MRALVPACALVVIAACSKPPPECNEESLSRAARAEAASNKVYARKAVLKALEATAQARAALDKKEYERAATLCKDALQASIDAELSVDAAKKRQTEIEPLVAATSSALADVEVALKAGRSLLDVVPQAQLDEKLRGALAQHATVKAQAAAAKALMEGSGYGEDVAALVTARDAALKLKGEADAIVLDIRRGATVKCKPRAKRPLFFGVRARSHDGYALVEAGESEEEPTGFVSVVKHGDAGGCRTISSQKLGDKGAIPSAIDPAISLTTWRMGGLVPVRLLFAWDGRNAWFFGDSRRWSFDAAKVARFADRCEAVSCGTPRMGGDHIDVQCTCTPKPGVNDLELARDVRFSWHGSTVLAER